MAVYIPSFQVLRGWPRFFLPSGYIFFLPHVNFRLHFLFTTCKFQTWVRNKNNGEQEKISGFQTHFGHLKPIKVKGNIGCKLLLTIYLYSDIQTIYNIYLKNYLHFALVAAASAVAAAAVILLPQQPCLQTLQIQLDQLGSFSQKVGDLSIFLHHHN